MTAEALNYPYISPAHPNPAAAAWLPPPIRRALDASKARVVLDLGCGNGAMSAELKSPARELYGCDLSESGVRMAAHNLGANRVTLAAADSDLTKLFDGIAQWDAIASVEVIEHLYEPRSMIRQAYRALKPGGSFIVSTPYHGYLKNVALSLAGRMDSHFTATWDYGHIKFFSRATLTKLLEEAGFRVVSFEGAGRMQWLWHSMVLRAVKV